MILCICLLKGFNSPMLKTCVAVPGASLGRYPRWKTQTLVLVSLFLTACVRTEITHESSSYVAAPFHKMLICSLAVNPREGARFESVLFDQLKGHLKVDTCNHWASMHPDLSTTTVHATLGQEGFDAVLIIERKTANGTYRNLTTLESFWNVYSTLVHQPLNQTTPSVDVPGNYVLHGRSLVISVAKNTVTWSFEGLAEGVFTKSLKDFMKTVASRVEYELEDGKLIPSR